MNEKLSTWIVFLIGFFLAVIQFAYYFLFEAFITSSSITYFIVLLFWLIGFLIGLNIIKQKLLFRLILISVIAYYLALVLNLEFLFNKYVLFVSSPLIVISGISPGYIFSHGANQWKESHLFFLHENNGFIFGVLFSLFAILFKGFLFLKFAPIALFFLIITETFFNNLNNSNEKES